MPTIFLCFQGINFRSKFIPSHSPSLWWTSRLHSYSRKSNTFTYFSFFLRSLTTCRQICRRGVRYVTSNLNVDNILKIIGLRNRCANIKPQSSTLSNAASFMFYAAGFTLYLQHETMFQNTNFQHLNLNRYVTYYSHHPQWHIMQCKTKCIQFNTP